MLRAVATGDLAVLQNLRRICAPGAWLEVVVALDPERDAVEIARLGLEPLTPEFLATTLLPRYRAAGFEITEQGVLPPAAWPQLHTSWAQRLRDNPKRVLIFLIARVLEP